MGICLSCLNRDLDGDFLDEDEQSRFLYNDPNASHYGSFGGMNPRNIYADPAEAQRASEALMKVVTKTSDHLIDIFAMIPQTFSSTPNTIFPGQEARPQYYKNILESMSVNDSDELSHKASSNKSNSFDEWAIGQSTPEKKKSRPKIKSEGIGPFLGGFADPASAIE